ncbi:MAG TPA: hypothetical protein VNX67_00475, partial [Solirubrobacteraceae bacterium]|nr:hypothetical protein [Solirubrobacteraceae bacterium]
MKPPKPLACLVQINKNAGASTAVLAARNYPPGSILNLTIQGRRSVNSGAKVVGGPDEDVHLAVADACAQQRRLACIAANLPYGLHAFLDRPVEYFAFLRAPVARCISYWHHAYRLRHDGRLWATLQSYDLDLDALLRSGLVYQFSNDQVRMISGSAASEPGEQEYLLARENIEERFVFVGAVEHYRECVAMLARRLGWHDPRAPHVNRMSLTDVAPLPSNAARIFREANEWDDRLHRWLVNDYLKRASPSAAA